jgi:hypothetical protein
MNIYWLQKFWFHERRHTDTQVHRHFLTVDLPEVNIDAQIWLTAFSPGRNVEEQIMGAAAAGVKSFRFIDSNGLMQFRELDSWQGNVRVERCIQIMFAFHVQFAWAKAEGMIYWHD